MGHQTNAESDKVELIDISLLFAGLNFRQAIFASPYNDWEAPTGGYLLTACMASGRTAASAAVAWLKKQLPAC